MSVPRTFALLATVVIVWTSWPSDAEAVRFRRPYHNNVPVSYGFDNNYGSAGCTDYNCGTICYDGHGGNDFPLGLGTDVIAAAEGRVTRAIQGCANYGFLGSTCGAGCGNYVGITYDDGTYGLYCHMQNGSLAVRENDRVTCGQFLGRSASSGNSTGPHLHFGWRRSGTNTDAYAGRCTSSPGGWVDQRGYREPVGTDCENRCACSPGAGESRACGNCGTQRRTCGGDCQWGAWSGCEGQGECAAGSRQERPCCDCGAEVRTCSAACGWSDWSACAGADPAGPPACDTELPGVCADGRVRCLDGCLACTEETPPSDELCDGLDNDCDEAVDEGGPTTFGATRPRYAARVVDVSYPRRIPAGTVSDAWVVLENEGTERWSAGELWWGPAAPADGVASPFEDVEAWPAFDAAAVVDRDVAPGDTIALTFTLRVSRDAAADPLDTFRLHAPDGTPVTCPSDGVSVAIAVDPPAAWGGPEDGSGGGAAPRDPTPADAADTPADEPDAGVADAGSDSGADAPGGSGGCSVAAPRSRSAADGRWALCLVLGLAWIRRARRFIS